MFWKKSGAADKVMANDPYFGKDDNFTEEVATIQRSCGKGYALRLIGGLLEKGIVRGKGITCHLCTYGAIL